MDIELQKIKDSIEKQKVVLEPIRQKFFKESDKLEKLKRKLDNYRLSNGMFYPVEKMSEFSSDIEDVEAIALVAKTKSGNLKIEWFIHEDDDIIKIDKDGHLHISSYSDGIIQWDEKKNRYVLWQHHVLVKTYPEIVGLYKIVYNSENKYDISPPDERVVSFS